MIFKNVLKKYKGYKLVRWLLTNLKLNVIWKQ